MKQKKVKSKTQYKCDDHGKNCKILYKSFYDNKGRLTKYIEYSGSSPFLTAYYSYNKFDKADTVFRQFSGERKYVSQLYRFNEQGRLLEYLSCFSDSSCEPYEKYEYNNAGQLIRKVEMKKGSENVIYDYRYDQLGNNTEVITKYVNSPYSSKELQYFDKANRVVKSVNMNADDVKTDSTEFEYDERGNLTHLNWMGGLNTIGSYKYDAVGNEIEYWSGTDHRIMTYRDRLVQTRIHYKEKTIEYYFRFAYEFFK